MISDSSVSCIRGIGPRPVDRVSPVVEGKEGSVLMMTKLVLQ
jgi:hypothetical protein